ncbi:tripartite tricarboxylate transporter substrate binding protein [Humitalea sp. 24SJ18S-53]|uniref:tripartite tricarboxylate transporter substrate binding protein n=1 Tax=Humitalea sp. 24SJ18S-53 TaxID=3422307 RepID=UPI003D675D0F
MAQSSIIPRRALLAAPLLAMGRGVQAQPAYPDRPITVVIPYPPGGGTDSFGRPVSQLLGQALGQSVVVENRGGGATSIGSTYVARARPDGYTLLLGSNSLAINPALDPSLTPRDPMRELSPVGLVYRSPFLLLVQDAVPARTLAEFIAYMRANPGRINYASSGNGSANHLVFALLAERAGVEAEHVPYRGLAPALLDLSANRVQAIFCSALLARPLLDRGVARAIAVSSAERMAALPDLPPVADTLPGFDAVFWQGLFAPAGTPQPIIDRLHAALIAATSDSALQARAVADGSEIRASDPQGLERFLAEETRTWAALVRQAKLTADPAP